MTNFLPARTLRFISAALIAPLVMLSTPTAHGTGFTTSRKQANIPPYALDGSDAYTDSPGTVDVGANPLRDPVYRGGLYSSGDLSSINFVYQLETGIASPVADTSGSSSGGTDPGDDSALDIMSGAAGAGNGCAPALTVGAADLFVMLGLVGVPANLPGGVGAGMRPGEFLAQTQGSGATAATTPKPSNGYAFPWEGQVRAGGSSLAPTFVNTQTGDAVTQIDLFQSRVAGDLSMGLTLFHNSEDQIDIGWGTGWRSSYDFYIVNLPIGVKSVPQVAVCYPDGRQLIFTQSSVQGFTNLYSPPTGFYDVLSKVTNSPAGTYILRTKNQMSYFFGPQNSTTGIHGGPWPGFTASRLTSIQDRYGNHVSISNTSSGFQVTDQFNRSITINTGTVSAPNASIPLWSGVTSVSDFSGHTYSLSIPINYLTYNGTALLSSITYPTLNGTTATEQFAYSGTPTYGYGISQETARDGTVFKYTYDSTSQLTGYTLPGTFTADTGLPVYANGSYTYTYTSTNATRKDTFGYTKVDNYSGGELHSSVDEMGFSKVYGWDGSYNLITRANQRGYTSHFTPDAYGNVISTQTPLQYAQGVADKRTYNAWNSLTSTTDTRGAVTRYNRNANAASELNNVEDGLSHILETYTYNAYGDLKSASSQNATTTITPDSWGRPSTIQTPDRSYTIGYSGAYPDIPASVTDNTMGRTNTFSVDAWGRVYGLQRSDNATASVSFDLMNRPYQSTDWLGRVTTATYDSIGRVIKIRNARGDTQNLTWRDMDSIIAVQDGNGNTKTWLYTPVGDLARVSLPDQSSDSCKFDAAGNVSTRTNALAQVTVYTTDQDNRRTQVAYPDGTSTTEHYDFDARPSSMTDATGTTSWTFDFANNITNLSQPEGALTFAFDQWERPSSTTSPAGTISYGYTGERLTSVTSPQGEVTSWTYSPSTGLLTQQTNSNGTYTAYSYDNLDRLWTIGHYQSSGTSIETETYGYDLCDNLTSKTVNGSQVTNYSYDSIDQLLSETAPTYTLGYTYDGNHNRLSKTLNGVVETYSYNTDDRILSRSSSAGSWSYQYDTAGRTTSVTSPSGATSLAYDFEDRLTGISGPSGTGLYTYNGVGARTSKAGTNARTYLRDGVSVTNDVLSDGVYTITPGVSEHSSAGTNTFHLDQLGTPVAKTNSSGAEVASYQSDAFGNLVSGGLGQSQAGFAADWGYQEDGESGLKMLGNRYYDPSTGRFITRDPIYDGTNWYAYADNNPVRYADPAGLELDEVAAAAELAEDAADVTEVEGAQPVNPLAESEQALRNNLFQILRNWVERRLEEFLGDEIQESRRPGRRGGPAHRRVVAERERQLKEENPDWEHTGGGSELEESVPTKGGYKSSRAPDLSFKKPDGTRYFEQIGRSKLNGFPVAREMKAIDDLLRVGDPDVTFTPYDRLPTIPPGLPVEE